MNTELHQLIEENDNLFDYIKTEKQKFLKKAYSRKLSILGIISLGIFLKIFPQLAVEESLLLSTIVCGSFILLVFLILSRIKNESILPAKAKREFYATYKLKLVGNIIKLFSDELYYRPQNRILNKIIIESEFFKKITEFKGRNLIGGEFETSQIQISELQLLNGLSCVFEGVFVFVTNIDENKLNLKELHKLNAQWRIRNGNLYIKFDDMKKLFQIRVERSDRSIEKVKKEASFLLNLLSIVSNAIDVKFTSQYNVADLPAISEYDLAQNSYFENPLTGEKQIIASSTKRIHNFLYDQFSSFVLWFVLIKIGVLIFNIFPNYLFIVLSYLFFMPFYYIFFETIYSQSIGKMITKTKVISLGGIKPNFKVIVIRTLCRFIPYDLYSFIDKKNGFHDRFSKTVVVAK